MTVEKDVTPVQGSSVIHKPQVWGGVAPVARPPRAREAWQSALVSRALLVDVAAIVVAVAAAYLVRFDLEVDVGLLEPRGGQYLLISVVLVEAWVLALGVGGARSHRVLGSGREEVVRAVRASLALFGLVAVICYLLKFDLARSYVAVALPVGLALLLAGRALLARRLHADRARGEYRRRTLLVGALDTVHDLGVRMRRARAAGFDVVGVCVPGGAAVASPLPDVPVLGDVREAPDIARRSGIDAVAVTASDTATTQMIKQFAWDLEPTGADLLVVPGLADVASPRLLVTPVDGVPVVQVAPPGYTGTQHVLKRAFDVAVAGIGLVLVALPLLLVAGVVRLTSPGPALFRQERIGLNGEPFTLYKLRTMRLGAEAQLAEALDGVAGVFYKPKADPRVTRFGRFLRRYSIDEFPQLLNVLKGDMSLVGPRPQVAFEVAQYDDALRRRLLVKPGLTGLWQVSGRNDLPLDQSTRLDLYYVENWTLVGDIGILLRTARAVLSPDGAY
ncbi:sugar transferase [Isoptericola cucumis]|uniref:Polyprenyl glycosylphosphotransferase n=1 Tax=Isoptericola cucumis TaxID=1776856 RepID=A0ABQ2B1P5_9MICO|nr:sugar transferase [Isoptericola cucumis]GGI05636.1 polyprenyl glycosylphosphotransferase [Isoptericola cucumis]